MKISTIPSFQLRSNTYDLDFTREYAMYSSKQFEEYQPVERTSPYDPAKSLEHHVMHCFVDLSFFHTSSFRQENSLRNIYSIIVLCMPFVNMLMIPFVIQWLVDSIDVFDRKVFNYR